MNFDKKILIKVMNKLFGTKIIGIKLRPTQMSVGRKTFVLNFDNSMSFEVNCFIRITYDGNLVLTCCDDSISPEYRDIGCDISDDIANTLLATTIKRAEKVLINSTVSSITVNNTADIVIVFENGARILIFPDCLLNNYQYYALIDNTVREPMTYSVGFENGEIIIEGSREISEGWVK